LYGKRVALVTLARMLNSPRMVKGCGKEIHYPFVTSITKSKEFQEPVIG
jgi:hypothetical protein